ncbi:MAG: radical SAM protein [Rhodothermales bacterium]
MKPILCNYYLTYRCNAKCGFCDIWEQPSPLVDEADVRQNLAALRRLGVRFVDFTGGEPLLHPKLPEFLAEAHRLGMRTTVTTNGLLYPKRAEQLAGKVDLLHFSIDSSDSEEHNRSRGVDCFDKLMESIEVALEIGERPDLLFTVTNHNVDDLERIYETISFPNGLVLIVNPLFEYGSLGESLSTSVLDRMERFAERPLTYLNPSFLDLRRKGGNDPADPVCKAVSTCVVISPSNELVLPCYHYGLDRFPIEGRLEELWRSQLVAEHRALEGRHEVCRGCTINCYFEPSFAVSPGSRYFWRSLPSKLNYGWTKFVTQRMDRRAGPRRAILPDRTEKIQQATEMQRATEMQQATEPAIE